MSAELDSLDLVPERSGIFLLVSLLQNVSLNFREM